MQSERAPQSIPVPQAGRGATAARHRSRRRAHLRVGAPVEPFLMNCPPMTPIWRAISKPPPQPAILLRPSALAQPLDSPKHPGWARCRRAHLRVGAQAVMPRPSALAETLDSPKRPGWARHSRHPPRHWRDASVGSRSTVPRRRAGSCAGRAALRTTALCAPRTRLATETAGTPRRSATRPLPWRQRQPLARRTQPPCSRAFPASPTCL
jgi:hypothetical protein